MRFLVKRERIYFLEKDFEIENRIKLHYNGDSDIQEVMSSFEKYIKDETLSTEIVLDESLTNQLFVNDKTIYLDVERV